MQRREAVQYISLLLGGTIIGANYFLEGCKSKTGISTDFTPETIALLDEVADTILPPTKTPGAKAAKVGQFMTVMVNDCYEAPDQKIFHEGISKLDEASNKKNGKSFMESTPQERHDLLVDLDKESKAARRKQKIILMSCPMKKSTRWLYRKIKMVATQRPKSFVKIQTIILS